MLCQLVYCQTFCRWRGLKNKKMNHSPQKRIREVGFQAKWGSKKVDWLLITMRGAARSNKMFSLPSRQSNVKISRIYN
jgi:hypothetical protein